MLTSVDLSEIRQLREHAAVPQGHVQDAVVGKRGYRRHRRRLLAAALRARGHEDGRVLARKRTGRPELARRVPKRLR